jgi:hypothetical protein
MSAGGGQGHEDRRLPRPHEVTSSSRRTGTPNTATTAAPTNFSSALVPLDDRPRLSEIPMHDGA